MSSNQTARSRRSNVNFNATFDTAIAEYQRVSGQRLEIDTSVAEQLESCNSPEDISKVLRAQVKKFNEFRRDPLERLLAQLIPAFNVISTLSGAVGDVAGLVSHQMFIRNDCPPTPSCRHSHPPM